MVLADEAATWTGVGALASSGLLLLLGLLLFTRWRRAAARELAQIHATSERTEALLAELGGALEDARAQGRRLAALGELGATLDLDAALARALQAVSELAAADAAMIVLRQDEGEPITASYGLTQEESGRDLIGVPPEGARARAVKLSYLYSAEEAARDEFHLAGALAVPLTAEHDERIGSLAVFWRRLDRTVADEELARFEELASAFGPALQNARLHSEARRLADTDPLTNLHSRRYFDEQLRRECARARRYGRALGLLLFEAEGEVTDLPAVGEQIRSVVRSTDVACYLGEARFAVVMPEAGEGDVERLHRRLQFALGGPVDLGQGLSLFAGLVELQGDEDASMLLQRAQDALEDERTVSAR